MEALTPPLPEVLEPIEQDADAMSTESRRHSLAAHDRLQRSVNSLSREHSMFSAAEGGGNSSRAHTPPIVTAAPSPPLMEANSSNNNNASNTINNSSSARSTTVKPCASVHEIRARMLHYSRPAARFSGTYYTHALGIVNPGSGERAAADAVRRGMCSELGPSRVIVLDGNTFADPSGLRQSIKEYAVAYHIDRPQGSSSSLARDMKRGTIIVSGGDGTIAFVMDQMHITLRELRDEFRIAQRGTAREGYHVDDVDMIETSSSEEDESDDVVGDSNPRYVAPALAPIPLGTGNDYSNCMGFGAGFTQYKGIGCCFCCETDVAALLREATQAPCVRFDRWAVDVVPLRVALQYLRPVPPNAAAATTESSRSPRSTPEPQHPSCSTRLATTRPPSIEHVDDALIERPKEPNVANTVHHVKWSALHRDQPDGMARYTLTNYLGIGYDAYVAGKFDHTRREHPKLCSTRTQNKMMYLLLGVKGAMQCKTTRKMLPMVCVPNPWSAVSGGTTALSAGRQDMVGLRIPSQSRALLLTNVNCYGAGTKPWNPKKGSVYHRPVHVEGATMTPTTVAEHVPITAPVSIDDRKFELQAMGGLLDFGALGMGMTSATKLSQTGEAFIFVLCTPEDLRGTGSMSPYTTEHLSTYRQRVHTDSRVRASLSVQIDGEVVPPLTEPSILHVHPQSKKRLFVRCQNPKVVRQGGV